MWNACPDTAVTSTTILRVDGSISGSTRVTVARFSRAPSMAALGPVSVFTEDDNYSLKSRVLAPMSASLKQKARFAIAKRARDFRQRAR